MLKKLLKYDFKTLLHTLIPVYGISLILSVLSNIFIRINKITPIFRIPSSLITGLSIVVCIGTIFISFIIGIINFYKQTVKDEGYLLHTLPVSKNNIIISKLTSITAMELLSLIVCLITIVITLNINPKTIIDFTRMAIEKMQGYKITTLLILIAVFLGQILNTLLIYTSISFGQKHSTNKLLYSIIYGVVIYNATQIITMLIYLPFITNKKYMDALNETLPPVKILNTMMIITIIATILTSVVYYILTKRNLEKKLNLE
jgi:hypothetical protein